MFAIIFIIFIFLCISAFLSLLIPEEKASKFWLVSIFWEKIGKPLRDYLLRKVTNKKIVLLYLTGMFALNGTPFLFSNIKIDCGDWHLTLTTGQVDTFVLIVDLLVSLVVFYQLYLSRKRDGVQIEDTVERILAAIPNTNDEVKELIPLYRDSISKLHIKEAYKHLCAIRQIVCKRNSTDYEFLATIDYLKGMCSRYITGNDEKAEITCAYDEMIKAKVFLVEIVGAYLELILKREDRQQALVLSCQILEKYPDNPLAKAAMVVLADNVKCAYADVDNNMKNDTDFLSIIFDYIYHHPEQDWFDIVHLKCSVPKDLTYENIRRWGFCISISTTQLLRESHYFSPHNKNLSTLQRVYDITTKYKALSAGTDIEGIFPDADFIALYSEFQLTDDSVRRNEIMEAVKKCKVSKENKMPCLLMRLEMLIINRNYDDVVQILDEYKDSKDETIAGVYFVLATRTFNVQYAEAAFEHLTNVGIALPDSHCQNILVCTAMYAKDLENYHDLIIFENAVTQDIFECVLSYFSKHVFDADNIKQLTEKAPKESLFILAKILGQENHTEDALKIIRPMIHEGVLTIEMLAYISIVRDHEEYHVEFFDALKKLRKNGVTYVRELLDDEYQLAVECNDLHDIGEVIGLLFYQEPDNDRVFFNYLFYLNQTGQKDVFARYVDRISQTVVEDRLTDGFFRLLIAQGFYHEGLEYLYLAILRTKSQELKDLWFQFMHTPHISPIINEEKDTVENGDFVVYSENGEVKNEDVFVNSNTENLIGHKVGDKVSLDRYGILSVAKIRQVFNKYQSLTRQIYKDLQQGKSKSIRMFTIEDLKRGDGNMLTNLMLLAGGGDNKKRMDDWEAEYAKGKTPLIGAFDFNDAYATCLNRIFGNERVFVQPYQYYANCLIEDYEYVLDITSVVLLCTISKKFSLSFQKKFIVPQGLYSYIQQALQKEDTDMPSFVCKGVFECLEINKKEENENGNVLVLKSILEWLQQNCMVEVATKKLALCLHKMNPSFFDIECESLLLTIDCKRCMISEDWGLVKNYDNFKIVNTEAFLYLQNIASSKAISRFLADLHFVGVNIDENYMFEQYERKASHKANSFDECLEALRTNLYLTKDGLNLANRILRKKIILPADSLTVTTIFDKMLEDKTNEFRKSLIQQMQGQKNLHPNFMSYLMDVVKMKRLFFV